MPTKWFKKFDNEIINGDIVLSFKAHGVARFVVAGFFLLSLCILAAIGVFIIFIVVMVLKEMLAGGAMMGGGKLSLEAVLIGGGFFTISLVLVTFFGIKDLQLLLHMIRSEDYIVLDQNEIAAVRRLGPFCFKQQLPREEVLQIYVERKYKNLVLKTTKGLIELTNLGTEKEREEAATRIRKDLGVPGKVSVDTASLPGKWEKIVLPEGNQAVITNRVIRKNQARMLSAGVWILLFFSLLMANESFYIPSFHFLWAITAVLLILSILLAWKAGWFYMGRIEWSISPGSLTIQKRFRGKIKVVMTASALELTEKKDMDGDLWYQLNAISIDIDGSRKETAKKMKTELTSCSCDPGEALGLGKCLSLMAEIPLHNEAGIT